MKLDPSRTVRSNPPTAQIKPPRRVRLFSIRPSTANPTDQAASSSSRHPGTYERPNEYGGGSPESHPDGAPERRFPIEEAQYRAGLMMSKVSDVLPAMELMMWLTTPHGGSMAAASDQRAIATGPRSIRARFSHPRNPRTLVIYLDRFMDSVRWCCPGTTMADPAPD